MVRDTRWQTDPQEVKPYHPHGFKGTVTADGVTSRVLLAKRNGMRRTSGRRGSATGT